MLPFFEALQTMDQRTYRYITSVNLFKSFVAILLFQSILSAPINSTISYETFLKNITRDSCAFPNGIVLPFKDSATTLNYFSDVLKICKAPEVMKRSLEAITMCNEIYDALKNITCRSDKNVHFPEIKIEFSENVCDEISSFQLQHSFKEKSLLQHLTDKLICRMMCEDDFLPACRMLLWSFQLQTRIDSILSAQPVQNTPDQEHDVAGNGESANSKMSPKSDPEDPAIVNGQLPAELNQEFPAEERINSNNKVVDDQHIVNDETDKNDDDQSLKNSNDEQNVVGENEMQKESNVNEIKGNDLDKKEDLLSKPGKQNENQPAENEAQNTKEETGEPKTEEQTQLDNNLPIKEKKIAEEEKPSKPTASNLDKTVLKNNPALPALEQVKAVSNKTELKKEIINIQKETLFKVKPVDTPTNGNNTSKNLQPTIPEIKNKSNKLQDIVLQPPILTKTSSIGVNEAKVSIKSETTLPKDYEIPEPKVIPNIGKEDVVSVTTVADLEKMEEGNGVPEPADKNQDLYNDMESEGEYSKIEYDEDGFYDSPKNKKPEEPDSGKMSKPALAENESPKYDVFPQRNSFGRGSDDIQVIPAFPEQEDSHFFFYFLSLVLILMAGYLLFHNKQKIIALIVEGRHERRRRSHGLGYKKLETK